MAAIDHFFQQEPDEGAAATEKTLVWLFFDDDNFYVSVRSFDTQPDRLVANELRRDNFNIYNNDNITISIDPLYTRRSGVFFQTNALSAQRDQEVQDERSNNNDWNTIWRTRSRILDDGWSMEFAIPYLVAALPPGGSAGVGLQYPARGALEERARLDCADPRVRGDTRACTSSTSWPPSSASRRRR